ncbi:MAG: zf-HC2 domain-containing protein [Nitrospirota bacterium]
MKSAHQTMEWLVMQYHDGQLPDRHRPAVEAHLVECDPCRRYRRSTQSAGAWLQGTAADAARAVEMGQVWRGVADRLSRPAPARLRFRRWAWAWRRPARLSWLAAGSLAAGLFLLLVNPYGRLPATAPSETYVAFVEASDYPVMVFTPSQPGAMTVIWLFEPPKEFSPST